MCISATTLLAGGMLLQGITAKASGDAAADASRQQAAGERDAAQAQAERIMQETARRRSAARAATAASGAAIDEFSMGVEQEILSAGETDAAMTVLTGKRRGRQLEDQAAAQKAGGTSALVGSLFGAAGVAFDGWQKAQKAKAEKV